MGMHEPKTLRELEVIFAKTNQDLLERTRKLRMRGYSETLIKASNYHLEIRLRELSAQIAFRKALDKI
jgi:predicted metalloprotease